MYDTIIKKTFMNQSLEYESLSIELCRFIRNLIQCIVTSTVHSNSIWKLSLLYELEKPWRKRPVDWKCFRSKSSFSVDKCLTF